MSDTPLLVDAKWLSRDGDTKARPRRGHHVPVRIADLRWSAKGPPARQMYESGHVPGAVFVDLDRDLAEHPGPGRHPFPSEEQFARLLSRLGIGGRIGDGRVAAADGRRAAENANRLG